jgi:hypothetical protein
MIRIQPDLASERCPLLLEKLLLLLLLLLLSGTALDPAETQFLESMSGARCGADVYAVMCRDL